MKPTNHDPEIEMAALGACLIDVRAAEIALTDLRQDDFFIGRHRCLFETISELFSRGVRLDELTLTDELRKAEKLEYAGGREFVGRVIMRCPTAANIEQYIQTLQRYSELRSLEFLRVKIEKHLAAHDVEAALEDINTTADSIWNRRLQISNDPQDLHSIAEPIANDAVLGEPREMWGLVSGVADGAIDELTGGFSLQSYIVLAARTSVGKSTLCNAIARGIRENHPEAGAPLIVSTEMSTQGIARAALASSAGVHTEALLRRNLGELQRQAVENVIKQRRLEGVRVVHLAAPTVAQIKAIAKRHQRKHGLALLIVDLAGKLKAPGSSEYERFSNISNQLAALKSELNCCVIACVQVNRSVALSEDKRPELHHLKGSGSWEEDADKVLLLYRPAMHGAMRDHDRTEVIQAKDRDNGRLGSVWIEFRRGFGRYVAVEEESR